MEEHICCRQALRTTDATAQRDYPHTTIQLWCTTVPTISDVFGRKASPVGERDAFPLLLRDRMGKTMSIFQIKSEKMTDWAITFLISFRSF